MASICVASAPQLRSSGWGVPVKITQIRDLRRGCEGGDSEAHACVHVPPASSNPLAAPVPKNPLRVQCSHIAKPFLKYDLREMFAGLRGPPRPQRQRLERQFSLNADCPTHEPLDLRTPPGVVGDHNIHFLKDLLTSPKPWTAGLPHFLRPHGPAHVRGRETRAQLVAPAQSMCMTGGLGS